ncbi:hypothetical protein [Bacillus suaedae]|uniref:Uncharacterized protein n=1 Tax=Halalkalibacter suaedae TaxID=2822140 RepID=A0A940WR13_9BACI|nr:hypothetical protein [Bacillus suaedae]MBP3950930.1 hypothetical protein [Bacillus suaedae]
MYMIIVLPIAILIGFIIFVLVNNSNKSGMKLMLLGISVIIVGGIILLDNESNWGGFEYLFVLNGLLLSVLGFSKNN